MKEKSKQRKKERKKERKQQEMNECLFFDFDEFRRGSGLTRFGPAG